MPHTKKFKRRRQKRSPKRPGKVRYAVAMWLLGLPLPLIIIALFFRGCDW